MAARARRTPKVTGRAMDKGLAVAVMGGVKVDGII